MDNSQFDFNMMTNEGIVTNLTRALKSIKLNIMDFDLKQYVSQFVERGGYNKEMSFDANKKECISFCAYKLAFSKNK